MKTNTYDFKYDEAKNLCYVYITGELNAEKIRETYIKIYLIVYQLRVCELADTSYLYEYNEIKKRFIVNISEDILPDKIYSTFLNIFTDKRGSAQYCNILWLMQNANIPESLTYDNVSEKAQEMSYSFPVGLKAIVADPNSSVQKQLFEYYRNIAILNTQRIVKIFISVEEAEEWLDSVK